MLQQLRGAEAERAAAHAHLRVGDQARLALGVNLIVPGNPMPIRDEGVNEYVNNAQSNLHPRFWEALFPDTPILPLPYVGAYWVF